MKRFTLFTFMLIATLVNSVSVWAIIPEPQSYVRSASSFLFTPKTVWSVENDEQAEIAGLLIKQIEKSTGFNMSVLHNDKASKNVVRFITDDTMRDEQYQLIVDTRAITISASSRKGFFNALQSLRQLLPAEIESPQPTPNMQISAQGAIVKDNPYLEVRAIRLKKQSTSLSKNEIFKFIDLMGLHKLNRLYWDPIDENGMPFDRDALHEIGSYAALHCIELSAEEANIDEQITNPNLDNTIILEPEEVDCTLKDIYMYKPGSGLRYSSQLQGMIGNILGGESSM
ncbi:MAG: glycoside hydrolase family 20 zincin-like fold domain-containing protein, partial [Bacteroidales bacterium]